MNFRKRFLVKAIMSTLMVIALFVVPTCIGTSISSGGGTLWIFGWTEKSRASSTFLFTYRTFNEKILSKYMMTFSLVAFIVSLLYSIYNFIIFGVSFKKSNFIALNIEKIVDIVITTIIIILSSLFILSMSSFKNEFLNDLGINALLQKKGMRWFKLLCFFLYHWCFYINSRYNTFGNLQY